MNNFANANVDSGEKTWLTPPEIVHGLGDFDLDPCVADNMPWNTAKRMVTKAEDGLSVDWDNQRVWCNPPYGREAVPFLQRMARHAGGGLVLVFARTDTQAAVWYSSLLVPTRRRGRSGFFRMLTQSCLCQVESSFTELTAALERRRQLHLPWCRIRSSIRKRFVS